MQLGEQQHLGGFLFLPRGLRKNVVTIKRVGGCHRDYLPLFPLTLLE